MPYAVARLSELSFAERPYRDQDAPRLAASLTEALALDSSRATVWRYPPGARGRRHREGAQEEVFVVLEGTITLALGEPAELLRVDALGFARVAPGTEIQVRNDSDAEALLLIWGAPPVTGQGEILDDIP
jgi:uncharacterized cupin superfamily protein